jgi:hypothetical protein
MVVLADTMPPTLCNVNDDIGQRVVSARGPALPASCSTYSSGRMPTGRRLRLVEGLRSARHQVVVFDATLPAESSFWAAMLDSTVDAEDDRHMGGGSRENRE